MGAAGAGYGAAAVLVTGVVAGSALWVARAERRRGPPEAPGDAPGALLGEQPRLGNDHRGVRCAGAPLAPALSGHPGSASPEERIEPPEDL